MQDRNIGRWLRKWNRKLHIYLGLYFLLFLWLFAVTGLFLNHPKWEFPQFWGEREQTSSEHTLQPVTVTGDLQKAQVLMQQLDISGEIENITVATESGGFDVRVVKPGKIIDIKSDLQANRATVEQIQVNAWGVMHMLHSFTGVRMNEPGKTREWLMTKLWSFSMDALSVGLIVMVLGGIYLWVDLRQKRWTGLATLGLGLATCGWFLFRWLL